MKFALDLEKIILGSLGGHFQTQKFESNLIP